MSNQHPASPPAPARDRPWFEVRCWLEPPVPQQAPDHAGAEPHWTTVAYCEEQTMANAIADALLRQPWHYYRRAEVWGPGQPDVVGSDALMLHEQLNTAT